MHSCSLAQTCQLGLGSTLHYAECPFMQLINIHYLHVFGHCCVFTPVKFYSFAIFNLLLSSDLITKWQVDETVKTMISLVLLMEKMSCQCLLSGAHHQFWFDQIN